MTTKDSQQWALAVAQLIERSLSTPEVRGLNPDIGKILSTNSTIEKTKIKKGREWPKKIPNRALPAWTCGSTTQSYRILISELQGVERVQAVSSN